eukprot:403374073
MEQNQKLKLAVVNQNENDSGVAVEFNQQYLQTNPTPPLDYENHVQNNIASTTSSPMNVDFYTDPDKIANPFIRALVIASQKIKKQDNEQFQQKKKQSGGYLQDGIKLVKIEDHPNKSNSLFSAPHHNFLNASAGRLREGSYSPSGLNNHQNQNSINQGSFGGGSGGLFAGGLFNRLTKFKKRITNKIEFIHNLPLEQQLNWKYNIDKCQFLKDQSYEQKYFENLKIKPGLNFFDYLSICDLESLKQLKINVPQSLCIFSTSSWLSNNQNGNGLEHRSDFMLKNFYQKIVDLKTQYNDSSVQQENEPVAILRTRSKLNQFKADKLVMSWSKFKDIIDFGIESTNSILQEYIPPYHSKTPSIIRYVFYNPKHRKHTQKLQITMIVVDFIKTQLRKNDKRIDPYQLYFSNLHVYRYKDIVDIPRNPNYDNYTDREILQAQKIKQVKMKYITCRLCKEPYERLQLTKIIPYKMIQEFISHLRKRAITLFDTVDVSVKKQIQQSCKVCDDCYTMILCEYDLIQTEKKLAKYMAVLQSDSNPDYQMHTNMFNHKPLVITEEDTIQNKEYVQWRAMIYVEEFTNFKVEALSDCSEFFMQINMFDQVFIFRVENTIQQAERILTKHQTLLTNQRRPPILKPPRLSQLKKGVTGMRSLSPIQLQRQETIDPLIERTVPVKKAKMFYFFTEKKKSYAEMIKPFFSNAQFEMKLQKEFPHQDIISTGSCFPLQQFSKNVDEVECQIITTNVYCFTSIVNQAEIFQAKVKFGVKRDRDIKFEQGMSLYEKNGVHFPAHEYFSSDPIPSDWIGLINSSTQLEKSTNNSPTKDNLNNNTIAEALNESLASQQELKQILHDMNIIDNHMNQDLEGFIKKVDQHSTDLLKRFNKSQQPHRTFDKLQKDKTHRKRVESYKRIHDDKGQQSPLTKDKQRCLLASNLKDLRIKKQNSSIHLIGNKSQQSGDDQWFHSKTGDVHYKNSLIYQQNQTKIKGRKSLFLQSSPRLDKLAQNQLETIDEKLMPFENITPYFEHKERKKSAQEKQQNSAIENFTLNIIKPKNLNGLQYTNDFNVDTSSRSRIDRITPEGELNLNNFLLNNQIRGLSGDGGGHHFKSVSYSISHSNIDSESNRNQSKENKNQKQLNYRSVNKLQGVPCLIPTALPKKVKTQAKYKQLIQNKFSTLQVSDLEKKQFIRKVNMLSLAEQQSSQKQNLKMSQQFNNSYQSQQLSQLLPKLQNQSNDHQEQELPTPLYDLGNLQIKRTVTSSTQEDTKRQKITEHEVQQIKYQELTIQRPPLRPRKFNKNINQNSSPSKTGTQQFNQRSTMLLNYQKSDKQFDQFHLQQTDSLSYSNNKSTISGVYISLEHLERKNRRDIRRHLTPTYQSKRQDFSENFNGSKLGISQYYI